MMVTIFEKIPDLFVEVYDLQFKTWANEFRKRGHKCAIVFNPVPGVKPLFYEDGRMVAVGCWLEAEVDLSRAQSPRVVIRPSTSHDEEMIARHTRALAPHVLQ